MARYITVTTAENVREYVRHTFEVPDDFDMPDAEPLTGDAARDLWDALYAADDLPESSHQDTYPLDELDFVILDTYDSASEEGE